jgi:hypothetical protein
MPLNPIELGAGAVAVVVARSALATHSPVQKDPQRSFTQAQRAAIFSRCGGRCEHHWPIVGRCRSAATHADHVWPWSKGGPTTLANAAGLCAFHNLSKGSRRPSIAYIRRLERRRRSYFPPGEPVGIERHRRGLVSR